jgi:menaquinone-dependent protoporphyrinogen IX oxidase
MKVIVVYKSISGFTKRYAEWIAEALKAEIFKQEKTNIDNLLEYDTIVYGGSLHAAGINGINLIKKNLMRLKDKNIIIFAVGASPFTEEIIDEITQKNFKDEERKYIKLFYLRGGFDFNKLNFINKVLMTLFRWKIKSKRNKTPDEKGMLAAYSKPADFTKKENIKELISYVNSLNRV